MSTFLVQLLISGSVTFVLVPFLVQFKLKRQIKKHSNEQLLTARVHEIVSITDDYISSIKSVLETDHEHYEVSREGLSACRDVFIKNAETIRKLHEYSCRIADLLEVSEQNK